MNFDLDRRRAQLSVGDLSDFSVGPQPGSSGSGGLWRAQLGTRWHRELREQALSDGADAQFEVPVSAEMARKGWTIALGGRIDQVVQVAGHAVLREIKTVTRALPSDEARLRSDYPAYFIQLAAYVALRGLTERAELVFVEVDTGLAQAVALSPTDERAFELQLESVADFLELRLRGRQRLRALKFRPAFAKLREGQETAAPELTAAVRGAQAAVLLEAPTGFGKTGLLLECALGELRGGNFDRVLYLTGKSTGQLHVVQTLHAMTAPGPDIGSGAPVAAWHVRNKAEHCVNTVFQCVREACPYLDGIEKRWPESGLSRFYLLDDQAKELASLRAAGKAARICPYEITRAALAFNDVWIGDYNYVFSPDSRGLFYERPGFEPARTLVLVDEAHNLASRVADAHSHAFSAGDALAVCDGLRGAGAPHEWIEKWESWARFLESLRATASLPDADRQDAGEHLTKLAEGAAAYPMDPIALGPHLCGLIWRIPSVAQQLGTLELSRLWWSPQDGTLSVTCLDAAPAIGAALGEFGGAILATATPGPPGRFAESCGIGPPTVVRAPAPWREGAYDVAVDLRVDTSFRHRQRHIETTAATIAAVHRSAGSPAPIAVFFPSFAYAESVARAFGPAALQPRRGELSSQNAWINDAVDQGLALFLVLGSGFAEGIDLLGGRVSHAIVVGPALPEVNPVQRARLGIFEHLGREEAFERVYSIPGMQKVNQALGRLVRAPGQFARVLLHCRRFAQPEYERLLVEDYRSGRRIQDDGDLSSWLRNHS